MQIREDDLTGQDVIALLTEHLDHMYAITPPESVHALDLAALRGPEVTFWTAWQRNELLGCGGLRDLGDDTGEIKSMRTVTAHRGRGVARGILTKILEVARDRQYTALYLETGSMAEFAPARALYERFGFRYCAPFADYAPDPNSVFMRRVL